MTPPHRRPRRLRLSRAKGWTKPAGAVVVARPTRWGNPWRVVPVRDDRFPWGQAVDVVHVGGDRHAGRFEQFTSSPGTGAPYWAVRMYELHLADHPDLHAAVVAELRGRDLLCWCRADQPCPADLLIELANHGDVSGAEQADADS
jgi:hypothetical protein